MYPSETTKSSNFLGNGILTGVPSEEIKNAQMGSGSLLDISYTSGM
jgi:hypothetical protein